VLLSGALPFEPTDEASADGFCANPKEWLRTVPGWKKLSRGWRRMILDCLKVDPGERLTVGAALQAECLPGREGGGGGDDA
jgi:hypothetical protein